MARSLQKLCRILMGGLLGLSSAMAYGQSITVQGKVVDANGVNITGSTQFRVQILSPDSNHCVLYDESRTLDLTTSNGLFSINVGSTGGTRAAPTTYTLEQVLLNRGTFGVDGSYCLPTQSGTVNYTPAASDNRKLTIQFQTGSSAWETIPEMDLNPVPFAVDARNLGGYPATQVVRVSTGTAPVLSAGDVTSLNALLDGTSTKFVSNSSGKGAQLPSFSSDPAGSPAGSVWFDTVSNSLKYRDNSGVVALSAAVPGGPITSVSGTGGLTGSGSSGAVSLSMATIAGVAGSYGSASSIPVLTVDSYGRISVAGSTPISGAAPTGTASGDLSGSFPGPTVAKIRGSSVSGSAPAPGQFFRFDDKGTPATTDDEWVPVSIRAADLRDNASGNLLPGACAANQVFHFNGLTGGYDCGAIAGITSSQLSTSATLPTGGTFRSVTVDTKGLITAGTNPTTIDDYAITDAVKNGGAVPKISSGSDSPSLPATALEGELFVATNSKKIYRYTTGAWLEIASAAGSGSLTDVLAGGGLSRSAAGSTVTLSLPAIAAVTNATKVSTDAFGRVTSAGALAATDIPALDWSKITTGRPTTVATSGLTDAMTNLNNAKGMAVGTAAPPTRTAATLNTFYVNSATGAIYYDDGTNWQSIAAAPGGFTGSLSGDVSGTQSGTTVDKIKGVGVNTTALTSGNFFRYNGLNWVNAMLSAVDLPTVPMNKGGTGLTAAGTADQFLSMKADASGLEYKSITAGTGVTLIPSAGGLQISAAGTGGTVTNVTASAPIVVATGSSTPSLTIAKATAAVDGYLDKADFAAFAGKLDATASFVGDVSGTYGATSVDKLKGRGVTYTSLASGNFLKYNGTNWINANLAAGDIGSGTLAASLMPAFTGDVTSSAGSTALTLGTVPTAKGGTGLTSIGTANQMLGMNAGATGLEYKTIAGGTGVTIGQTANTITINATGTGIASLNSLTASTQTFGLPGSSGLAPAWVSAGAVHTLNIPMASAASVTAGLLNKTDYDAFAAKLGTSTAFLGDVTGAYNATSVDRLKGNPLSNTGLATGQFLKFGGTNWSGSTISLADMVNNTGSSAMASAACTSGQTMYYDTTTKELKCQAISAASISSGILPVANGGTGASTLDGAGIVDKASAQVISGTKTFTALIIGALQVAGGSPGVGKVLTSDGSGNASWALPSAGVTGSGSPGYVAKFLSATGLANSIIFESSSSIGIGTNAPNSTVQVAGSLSTAITSKSSNYTLTSVDSIVLGNATSAAITLTLPTAAAIAGRYYTLKKTDSSANAVTVAANGSETIDGATSLNLTSRYQYVSVASDGANWAVIGGASGGGVAAMFTNVSNAAGNSLITSPTVTATGSGSATISVGGQGSPQIQINGGAWGTSGSIAAGQTLAIRLTSANAATTAYTATITGLTPAASWTVTTESALYTFSAHTFSNCGVSGQNGPTVSQCQTSYSAASWTANSSYFNIATPGIQQWTVPKTGQYAFDIAGASSGYDTAYATSLQRIGSGARVQATVTLTQGAVYNIVVGQSGGNVSGSTYSAGGGGGGSYVYSGTIGGAGLVMAAGGAGGAGVSGAYSPGYGGASTVAGVNGQSTTAGSAGLCDTSYDGKPGAGGTAGAGGQSGSAGWSGTEVTGGGAGWVSSGQANPAITTTSPPIRASIFVGGSLASGGAGALGGFGGGGASSYLSGGSYAGGGGGGGYSGGGGGGWNSNSGNTQWANGAAAGGGGGSYVSASASFVTTTSGYRSGHGYVTVTYVGP